MEHSPPYVVAVVEPVPWHCEGCGEILNLLGPDGSEKRWALYQLTVTGAVVIQCIFCGEWNLYRKESGPGEEPEPR